ncbi:MAG: GntR family transcriptional regulator [Fimbriimonas sp.]|nr:GntR family transcriptional regulator [Fimbriimonas sp.]
MTPTVRMIVESLRERILDGTFRVGGVLPSEHEMATQFQVGRGSIRSAIEVLVDAGELDKPRYARPSVARPLGRPAGATRTDVYVWLAQTIREDTSVPFLQGISRELAGTPYRPVVQEPSIHVENIVQADERKFLLDLVRNPNAAGAILWRDTFSDQSDVVAQLIQQGLPLVFVDSTAPGGLPTDHVGTANALAAKRCVKYLLDLGHRRIVCVSDSDIPTASIERIKGYWRAMRQAGLGTSTQAGLFGQCIVPELTHEVTLYNDPLGGIYAHGLDRDCFYSDLAHRIVGEILAIDPLPTALFVTYDVLASWVWAVLEGHGIRVPEDISIVGFDWRAQWEKSFADELTTASQDFEGFGCHAVELLLGRLSGEAPSVPRHILLDAPLVKRSSTSTPPSLRSEHALAADVYGS